MVHELLIHPLVKLTHLGHDALPEDVVSSLAARVERELEEREEGVPRPVDQEVEEVVPVVAEKQ